MDAGPKPTGMYLRRVSEQPVVSKVVPAAIDQGKRAATGFKIENPAYPSSGGHHARGRHSAECLRHSLHYHPCDPIVAHGVGQAIARCLQREESPGSGGQGAR